MSSTQLFDPTPNEAVLKQGVCEGHSMELSDDITSDCEVLDVTLDTGGGAKYAGPAKTADQKTMLMCSLCFIP